MNKTTSIFLHIVALHLGLARGLVMKNYMGNDYIAYPDNLVELDELKS